MPRVSTKKSKAKAAAAPPPEAPVEAPVEVSPERTVDSVKAAAKEDAQKDASQLPAAESSTGLQPPSAPVEPTADGKLEERKGAVMDGDKPEHIRDAIPVLGRYVDALAVRTFGGLQDDDVDNADTVINAFRDLSGVPVISMESAREHPCQGLADLLTIRETFGDTRGLSVTLTWAPHVKTLPKAVPNSFLLTAAAMGCEVRVAYPPGFDLHPTVMNEARAFAKQSGGMVIATHDRKAALEGSHVVYAKAWGPATAQVSIVNAAERIGRHRDWIVNGETLRTASRDAVFLHCLPVRRNVEVADEVLDNTTQSLVVDEAENRFHVQRVLLQRLLSPSN